MRMIGKLLIVMLALSVIFVSVVKVVDGYDHDRIVAAQNSLK